MENTWEPVPSYLNLFQGIWSFLKYYYENPNLLTPQDQLEKLNKYNQLRFKEIILVLLLAVFLTWLRYFLTKAVFEPLGKHFQLTESNQVKLPESAWKFLFYFFAWALTFYVVVIQHKLFQNPSTVWDGWSINSPVPMDIFVVYVLQTSFYLHSLYTTAFIDVWRKDSFLLLAHHVLTIGLLTFSHAFRYNKIGVLVLLFHDISDIQLEFSKVNVYFKQQGKKEYKIHETIATVTFCFFSATWFVSRIYWFPLKALYSAGTVTMQRNLGDTLPLLFFMNAQLWVLQAMNMYWFMLILVFLYKVITGQLDEVEDTREYDVEEKFRQKQKSLLIEQDLLKQSVSRKMEETVQNGTHHLNCSSGTSIRART